MSATLFYRTNDGTEIGVHLRTFGVEIIDIQLPVLGEIGTVVSRVAASELVLSNELYYPSNMILGAVVIATDYTDAVDKRARLVRLLTRLGGHRLEFDHIEKDKYFVVKLTAASDIRWVAGTTFEIDLTFACGPYRIGRTEVEQIEEALTGPETVYVAGVADEVEGEQLAHPTWLLENASGGDITDAITIENQTTNESITWQGTFEDGYFLRIDSGLRSVVEKAPTEDALGEAGTNVDDGILNGSIFPLLSGGEVNTILVTGAADCDLTIRYRPEF